MDLKKIWNEYTSSERTCSRKVSGVFWKQTFIVRDRDEDSKKAYYFVSSVRNHFQRTWDISDTIL